MRDKKHGDLVGGGYRKGKQGLRCYFGKKALNINISHNGQEENLNTGMLTASKV